MSAVVAVLATVVASAGFVMAAPAQAATAVPCSATPASTSTCAVTLHLASGTFAVHHNLPTTFTPTPTFTKPLTAGMTATENPGSGSITNGTIKLLPKQESNRGSTETIIFQQVAPGTAHGTISSNGKVTIDDQLQIVIRITKPITTSCLSTPITAVFTSTTTPYDPSTGTVTISDSTFSVPEFAVTATYPCVAALNTLNKTFPGTSGNELTLGLHGVLLTPPTPTRASTTSLVPSPHVPAATGGAVAGQPTTLTASISPGGAHGATGSVQFLATTADLGTPVTITATGTSSVAVLTTRTLPAGVSRLKAVYSGDGVYLPSTSSVVSYRLTGTPTVNVGFPATVVTAGSASPTTFSGVVSDPISNGPTLAHVRLTFAFSGVNLLSAATTHLAVCTTPNLVTTCTTVALSGTTTVTGHYGGHGTTSIALAPGGQIKRYFKLAFTTNARYGRLQMAVKLTTVTSSGTTVKATIATQTGTIQTLRSGSPVVKALTVTETVAGTHQSRQGYNAKFTVAVAKTGSGPTPSGVVTLYKALAATPSTKTPIGSVMLPTTKTLTVFLTSKNWVATQAYVVTGTYSGDPFYAAGNTATSLALSIAPPVAGTLYICTKTGAGATPAYVTAVSGGALPATAAVGSALPVSGLHVTAYLDHGGFTKTTYASAGLGLGFSPEGEGIGTLSTGAPTGKDPYGAAVDEKAHTVYVTAQGSNSVLAINEATNAVEATIPVGGTPEGVAVDATAGATGYVYVANSRSNAVSVIDAQSNTVIKTLAVGTEPSHVAVDPSSGVAYVTDSGSASVSIIDGTTVSSVDSLGTGPNGVAVDPGLGVVYVTYQSVAAERQLTTIDMATKAVTNFTGLSATTTRSTVAVNPGNHKIYVAGFSSVQVLLGNGTTGPTSVLTTIGGFAGGFLRGIAVVPSAGATGEVYMAGGATGPAYAFSGGATSFATVVQIPVGTSSFGVAVDPGKGPKGTAYIANFVGQSVSVIDGTTNTVSVTKSLSAGSVVTPKLTTVAQPLTQQLTVMGTGTIGLSTTTGNVTVGLTSFGWALASRTAPSVFSCTAATRQATIGVVNALPLAKPAVTAQPQNETVNPGSAATFTAAASGVAAPTVQWQSSVDGGGTWTTIPGATTTSYTTGAATGSDNGTQYRAVFTNTSGSATSTAATLTVNAPPTVTVQPADQTVTAGTTATFSAAATSRPAPTVQWQISTDGGGHWTKIPSASSTTLTVSSSKKGDGNEYRAVFTNPLGTATSSAATLSVATGGYRLVGADGAVYAFGSAKFFGSTGGMALNKPIVGMASTPTGEGYWLVASDGGVFSFGNATYEGSMGGQPLNKPIVGMASTPTGGGYWLVASDGGIFAFGNANFFGSTGSMALNKPIVGMASTPTGGGYWLVASDGGIFAFGNANFFGSTGSMALNKPIVGMASTPTGGGYWLVASDGGIFAFGNANFFGSTGSMALNKPIVGMASTPTGGGYWLVASDGGIFAFGNANFFGSGAGGNGSTTVVGITASSDGGGYWLATASGSVVPFGDAPLAGSAAGLALNAPIVGITD